MRFSTNVGCTAEEGAPSQGDVRLIPLRGVPPTAACDDVHLGGVEIFNDGRWGRICIDSTNEVSSFTIDAGVICRQLGFPFGSLLEQGEVSGGNGIADADYGDYGEPGELVWASDVVCSGLEDRLVECLFPQEFGANPSGNGNDYGPPSPPGGGLTGFRAGCSRRDGTLLSVACRRFEIEGAQTLSHFRDPAVQYMDRILCGMCCLPPQKHIVDSLLTRYRGDLVDIWHFVGVIGPPRELVAQPVTQSHQTIMHSFYAFLDMDIRCAESDVIRR